MSTGTCAASIRAFSTPVAAFTTLSLSTKAPLTLRFDASGSSDSYGAIVTYNWSFGDGTSGTERIAMHTFPAPGTYTVTLTVFNDQGYAASVSSAVTIGSSLGDRKTTAAKQTKSGKRRTLLTLQATAVGDKNAARDR